MTKRLFVLWIAACLLFLTACGRRADINAMDRAISCNIGDAAIGSFEELNVSFGKSGFFYGAHDTIYYYDPSVSRDYVLCSKPNCIHGVPGCLAYFPDYWTGNQLDWVAQYDGYVYCVAPDNGSIAMWKIDYRNGTRDVLTSFSMGFNADGTGYASDMDTLSCSSVDNVVYAGGYAFAWVSLHDMSYEINYTQLAAINLEDGSVTWLAENDGWSYEFHAACADYMLYGKERYLLDEVTEEEYYEQFGDGPGTIDGMYFESQYDYWCWYTRCSPREYAYYAFDTNTGESILIEEGTITEEIGEYGTAVPHKLYGTYDGKIVYGIYSMPEEELLLSIYLLDIHSGEKTLVADLGIGRNIIIAQGNAINQVLSDGTFMCEIPLSNEEGSDIRYYRLDLNTGELEPLFVDNYHSTFRIFSEAENGYYGKWYDAQSDMSFYWISREDFDAGNWDAAIKYQL